MPFESVSCLQELSGNSVIITIVYGGLNEHRRFVSFLDSLCVVCNCVLSVGEDACVGTELS